ncbi:MAG: YaiO family outer membrane beta-barrel protein [Acidobacteria bacterium]|nr:YaiO family outer membrane beta-barrel protein [Acidobacteriota bacterium]
MKRDAQQSGGFAIVVLMTSLLPLSAQVPSGNPPAVASPSQPGIPEALRYRYHLELGGFDNRVSNGFGHWWGGEFLLGYKLSERMIVSGQLLSQRRPGETEQLLGARWLFNWTNWFFTDTALSGGGPDNPAAFFPRFRYDLTANLKVPAIPGLILTAGLTRLYMGTPNNGRIRRLGAIYYWKRFVLQGDVNFNNARPGNRKSKSVSGAIQYGHEGVYWLGLAAGGGREAWQTLSLTPQDVEFAGYSTNIFLRKWLRPTYGIVLSYNYSVKRAAYGIHGWRAKFFLDF